MINGSYASVLWLLAVLSIFVSLVINLWRHGEKRTRGIGAGRLRFSANQALSGKDAELRAISLRAVIVGVGLAIALHANIFDVLKNPEDPAIYFGWKNWVKGAISEPASLAYEFFGILVMGFVLAFLSRLWSDLFDIVHAFKTWLRRRAGIEPRTSPPLRDDIPGASDS